MPSLASKKVKAFIRFEYETEMIIDMPAEESVSCVGDTNETWEA